MAPPVLEPIRSAGGPGPGSSPDNPRPGPKLTDFGLVDALDTPLEDGPGPVVGTPVYVAPEQLTGDAAGQGPWTDLYALGCLTWVMCTGHKPFDAASVEAVVARHLSGRRAPFRPRFAVPERLEAWLARFLEPDPGRRFHVGHHLDPGVRVAAHPHRHGEACRGILE